MVESFKINRIEANEKEPAQLSGWLRQVALRMQQQQANNKSSGPSISEQISTIMNGPYSQYGRVQKHTVDSKVRELAERTGLRQYLKNATQNTQVSHQILPNINSALKDRILKFIQNRIESYKGMIAIPAIQEDILSNFKNDGIGAQDTNDESLLRYINQLIIEEQKKHPIIDNDTQNLGKGIGIHDKDQDNNDFFKGLLPYN